MTASKVGGPTPRLVMGCVHRRGEACWHPEAKVRICKYSAYAPVSICVLVNPKKAETA